MTVLSDEMCKKFGVIEEKDDPEEQEKERKLVVNARKELCGAFLHKLNTTFVNYTMKLPEDKMKKK